MKKMWSLMCFSLYIAAAYSNVIEVDHLQSTIKDVIQHEIRHFKDEVMGAITTLSNNLNSHDDSNNMIKGEVIGVINDGALIMIYNVPAEGYWFSRLLGIPRPIITEEEFENIYPCKALQGNSNLDVQCIKLIKYEGSWEAHYRKCMDIGGRGLLEITKDRLPLLQNYLKNYLKRFDDYHMWIGGRSMGGYNEEGSTLKWPSGRNVSQSWGWQEDYHFYDDRGECMAIRNVSGRTFTKENCSAICNYSLCEMTPPTDIMSHKTLQFTGITDEVEDEFEQTNCGGEYNSRSGTIRHPLSGDYYQNNESCTWIIRGAKEWGFGFTFESLSTEEGHDFLTIREGESMRSEVVGNFSGESVTIDRCSPRLNLFCVRSTTNAAHLVFTSDVSGRGAGFVLHWEPLFCGSDYNSSRGIIRYQFVRNYYMCFWIIRAGEPITITFVTIDNKGYHDGLTVQDGESLESPTIFDIKYHRDGHPLYSVPIPVQTSKNAAVIIATWYHFDRDNFAFEIHWEPSGGK